MRMRAWWLVGLLVFMTVGPVPGTAGGSDGVVVERLALVVDNEVATGWLAYPPGAEPTTLLVVAHACCGHLSEDRFRVYEQGFVEEYGVAVVAMDYRGPGHWDVWTGHLDTIAVTEAAQERWDIERTVVWGVSMGGEVSGMAVAARPDLFDFWISTMGVTDLVEEFAALGLYPYVPLVTDPSPDAEDPHNPIGSWILEETGGPPGVAPRGAWEVRSPAMRTDEMVGLTHAYLDHNPGDMIVPVGQTLRTFDGLVDAGVPATLCLGATREGHAQGPYGFGGATPVGLMAHDWHSMGCTAQWLEALLVGLTPDRHHVASVYVTDQTTGWTHGSFPPEPL